MAPGLVVSPSLQFLIDRVNSLITREFPLLESFNDDFQQLSQILSSLKPLTEKYIEKPRKICFGYKEDFYRDSNEQDRKKIITEIEVANRDAEDLLDDFEIEALQSKSSQVRFQFKTSVFHQEMEKRIKTLIENFDDFLSRRILSDRSRLTRSLAYTSSRDQLEITFRDPSLYGRERETEDIIQVLLTNNSCHLSICPILGIAGIGKTAIVRVVYRDERIVKNFDARIWVSENNFSIEHITKVMIDKLLQRSCDVVEIDVMQNHLKSLLNGKKVLVVLDDDVWDDDMERWEGIIDLVASGGKGSSIIVTTRLQTVVHNISKLSNLCVINPAYELRPFCDDDAWSILSRYVPEVANEDMLETGKDIVAKCKGLPLFLKKAAKLLDSGGNHFWNDYGALEIADAELFREFNVRSSLKARFYNLPPIYRQCLAYCFIFPKGYEMEVEEVIRLWIANGLVDTEDAAEKIFKELVLKSFFPKPEENWLGIKIFKMRESVHNLVWLVARTRCGALEDGDQLDTIIPEGVQHLLVSYGSQSSGMIKIISNKFLHLRTCIFPPIDGSLLLFIFKNLISLRAFHLRGSDIQNLPMSIENLKHLRYLNLSSSVHLQLLPESICSLRFLQTLELSQCWKLQILPKSISELINLRSLYLNDCRSLIQLPDGIRRLANLRHLDLSECDSLIQIPDAIGELGNLRHLDLHDCKSLSQLPHVIGQLTNLIYFDISRCPNLNELPDGIGKLVSLRRLNLRKLFELTNLPLLELILCSDSGLSIKILHGLNNLEGELQIKGLEHVKEGEEAKEANLVAKENLSSLSLVWEDSLVDRRDNSEEVIECLRPPRNLNKLVIGQYRGSVFPTWVKFLMNVIEIQLFCCSECEDLPPLGHLPLLKKLCIFGMHSLKRINKEFYGIGNSGSEEGGTSRGEEFFPSLEELEFRELHNWKEWTVTDEENVFLRLTKLRLDKCPNLASLPLPIQRSVQKFEITGCEKLTVCHGQSEGASTVSAKRYTLHGSKGMLHRFTRMLQEIRAGH